MTTIADVVAAYQEAAEAYRELEQCEYELAAERVAHDVTRAELGAALLEIAAGPPAEEGGTIQRLCKAALCQGPRGVGRTRGRTGRL
jgi:hypothetical protein